MKISLWSMFLGCLIGQVSLSLLGFQTPKESFVALFWQGSSFFVVWLTMRAADLRQRAQSEDKRESGASR